MTQYLRRRLPVFLLICFGSVAACSSAPPDSDWRGSLDAQQADAGQTADDVELDSDAPLDDTAGFTGPVIKVATFNVDLLFDTICDSRFCGPNDFEAKPSQAEFDARVAQVAAAIDLMDADIVLLQEFEKQSVLDAVNSALENPYPVAELAETGYTASVDTAVLARGELVATQEYTELNDGFQTFSRNFLRLDLDIQGERAIVFSAHFKSKNNDQSGRRLAEAQTAYDIITQVAATHDGALVLMGGDLNDTPESAPLLALTEDGKLKRVAEGEDILDVFTYVYRQRRQAIDHLLVATTRGGRYVDGSVRSLLDSGVTVGYGGSDHNALVGLFEMR